MPADIGTFLAHVMNLKVLRAGGAAAGIFGHSGADNDMVHTLKKHAVTFAHAYRNPQTNIAELQQLAGKIDGALRALQLTNTLAEQTATALTDELQGLMNEASARAGTGTDMNDVPKVG